MMSRTTTTLLLILAALFAACSSISTNFDYDEKADFSGLSSYDWIEPPEGSNHSPLVYNRVVNSVNEKLAARGYTRVTEQPDFLVAAHLGSKNMLRVVDWGYNYHPNYYYRGVGSRDLEVREYEEGSVVLDIIDGSTKELLWRGTARKTVDPDASPQQITKTVDEAVEKLLQSFPPS